MDISSDQANQHAGGSINSNNILDKSVHYHDHHYHDGAQYSMPMPPKPHLRCPLPSPTFVGRKKELRRLQEFFTSSELDRKRFAVIGMGGCGKSQIALEFTHSFILRSEIYDSSKVFFIDATNTTTLEESYASIAQSKGVGRTCQDAILWLSQTQDASFILIDNVDNAVLDLAAYMPRSLNAHVLITTRLHDKGRQYASTSDACLDLDALLTEDAEELLLRTAMLQPGEMKEASVLVQELHCHALAIAQAGACIAFLRLTVNEYLERFRQLGTSLMDGKNDGVNSSALHGYSNVVRHTWELSYDQLPASSKGLFNLCAFLHHTGITQELFRKATEALKTYKPTIPFSPDEEAALAVLTKALESCQGEDGSFDIFALGRCLGPILSLSLMQCDPVTRVHSIHPLTLDSLQRVVSNHLPTSLLLMLSITSDRKDAPFLHQLLPHADSVMGRFTRESSSHPNQCNPDITEAFSFVYSKSGRHKEAEKMRLDVLSRREYSLGKNHSKTVWAMRNLASCWSDLGQHKKAKRMQHKVLSRRKHTLGEDDPDTVWAMNELASCWSDLGRHDKAEKMQLDVLARRKRLLGEDHPETVWAMRNLANCLSHVGRHEEAEKSRQDVLNRRRLLIGDDHPDTVWAMSELADCWSDLGRHKEAETMRLDILSLRKRLLGDDHPETVWAMDDLANCWSDLGRYEEAETLRLDVLSQRRCLLGENHPDTVKSMGDLAVTLGQLQRYPEAEDLCQEALKRQTRIFGNHHSKTIRFREWVVWITEQREAKFKSSVEENSDALEPSVQSKPDSLTNM